MPWERDGYRYEWGDVMSALHLFSALEELAVHDPECQGACTYYDVLRALDGLELSMWQLEALMLSMTGMDDTMIGSVMGCTRVTVARRLRRIRAWVAAYLIRPAPHHE